MSGTTRIDGNPNRFVTAGVLRRTAKAMIPFYRRIASNRNYALQWTRGVKQADLSLLERLLQQVGISSSDFESLATNAIGYFIDFAAPKPIELYTNATSILPGTTQFYFNTDVHQAIARAILPLYREIVCNRVFAEQVVGAIRSSNRGLLERLVRSLIPTRALRLVQIRFSGFALGFKYPQSRFVFYNEFFRELPG